VLLFTFLNSKNNVEKIAAVVWSESRKPCQTIRPFGPVACRVGPAVAAIRVLCWPGAEGPQDARNTASRPSIERFFGRVFSLFCPSASSTASVDWTVVETHVVLTYAATLVVDLATQRA
jgi:hypothetical protein